MVVSSIYFEFQEVFKKRFKDLGEFEFESVTRLFSALSSKFELIKKSSLEDQIALSEAEILKATYDQNNQRKCSSTGPKMF